MKNIEYRRSLFMRGVQKILKVFYKIFPKAIYNFFYSVGRRLLWMVHRVFWKSKFFLSFIYKRSEKDEIKMIKFVDKLLPYTMGGPLALTSTFKVVSMVEEKKVNGALVECGVAKGGCGAMMAIASKYFGGDRSIWLFDSFEGLPKPTDEDFNDGRAGEMIGPLREGMLVGKEEQVSELIFNKCQISPNRARIVKGWFQDTLPTYKAKIGPIAVLRLDGDWYKSTMCCLKNLYDNVSDGGFVIIDDYATCYGSERAVTEFLEKQKNEIELVPDGRGGCYFKKCDGSKNGLERNE